MIRIGNIKNGAKGIYIGRAGFGRGASPLGNPFPMKAEADRSKVIAAYASWLQHRIEIEDPRVLKELKRIKDESRTGDVTLVCYCAPRPCHGDIIRQVVESMP